MLKAKKKKLQTSVNSLLSSADTFALEAEKEEDMSQVVKSNAMRRAAKEKAAEISAVDKAVGEKEAELKGL